MDIVVQGKIVLNVRVTLKNCFSVAITAIMNYNAGSCI